METPPTPGDTHLHRFEVHKRVATRLQREAGVTTVDAEPSPMRPVRLAATLDCAVFFDQNLAADEATLEFAWRPRSERDAFRIQYTESGVSWSCGWHQDDTHENLGPKVPHREPASFTDSNPMAILETCLSELRDRVPDLLGSVRPNR